MTPRTLGALLLLVVGILAGCSRRPTTVTFRSEPQGFVIDYPAGWSVSRADDDARVWFTPAPAGGSEAPHMDSPEFIVVFTVDVPGPLGDDEARRLGLTLLPIHGVSGFRRFKDEGGAGWHRFEVTGSSRRGEWASVGLLVSGPARLQYVVCAKPLEQWREGQKACDELLKTFQPGPL